MASFYGESLAVLIERTANYTDFDFIHSCILFGEKKGHYAVDVSSPLMLEHLKLEIRSVIMQQRLLDGRWAVASVFLKNNMRVSTLIMSAQGQISNQLEIYALSVAKKFQGQGIATQILDQLPDNLSWNTGRKMSHLPISARCSDASKKMQSMLEKRGFRVNNIDNGFNVLVRSSLDGQDVPDPLYATI